MATVKATFTFSLPEDHDSDQLIIYRSQRKESGYTPHETFDYTYGVTKQEVEIDDRRWYRLQFHNSGDNVSGPRSEPVYGGTFSHGAPFLAVSTTTDGAHYATSSDVYTYSGLTPQDVSEERVGHALRRSRAIIDFRTAEMGLDRFEIFETQVARRKYNASLRILKEAEINIALGNVYQNMADDIIIQSRRDGKDDLVGGTAIGGTSIGGDSLAERSENIQFLAELSDRYFGTGENLLSSLDANSIRLSGHDYRVRFPRFVYPFNGYGGYQRRYGSWGF